jgi:hypothetical protein
MCICVRVYMPCVCVCLVSICMCLACVCVCVCVVSLSLALSLVYFVRYFETTLLTASLAASPMNGNSILTGSRGVSPTLPSDIDICCQLSRMTPNDTHRRRTAPGVGVASDAWLCAVVRCDAVVFFVRFSMHS